MDNKLRLGILGGGGDSLIGVLHRVASSMHDKYRLIGGVFNPEHSISLDFGKQLGLDASRVYKDLDSMIESEKKIDINDRIQVVSVLTPNFLHYPMAKALLENDKPEVIDAIGDMVVVLTNLAHLQGVHIETCIAEAYKVISKRKGKMINGTFVKDE